MESELRVGVVTKTHGLKGEVKVFPTTDSPDRFDYLKHVTIKSGEKTISQMEIESVRYFKGLVILKFKGVDSLEDALKLKGTDLFIPREEGIELNEGEYYIADIIGMEVVDEDGTTLGNVRDVLEMKANDVYIVKLLENGKDLLLPAIDECILDVDIRKNIMTVHVMDGLMDL